MMDHTNSNSADINFALNLIEGIGFELERLVTFALRGHGCGGDSGGITFPADQDDSDKSEYEIPEGYVEMAIDSPSHSQEFLGFQISGAEHILITHAEYIQCLIEICNREGLSERVTLLEKFSLDPKIADDLVEASGAKCKERWREFLPFLSEQGWAVESEADDFSVRSPCGTLWKLITSDAEDLNVLYNITKRKFESVQKRSKDIYKLDYKGSLLEALDRFFQHEKRGST